MRTIEYSPDASGMRSSRLSSLRAGLLDLLGHPRLGDRLGQLRDLGRLLVALAELLLDVAELLAQDELALALVDLLLGLLADLARQAQHLDAVAEKLEHLVEARLQVEGLEDVLAFARPAGP